MEIIVVLLLLVVAGLGGASVFFYTKSKNSNTSTPQPVEQISELQAIEKASEIAKNKILEAEKQASEIENLAKQTLSKRQSQLKEEEQILDQREKKLLERSDLLEKRFDDLSQRETKLDKQQAEIKTKNDELDTKLVKIAGLSKEEAEAELKKQIEDQLTDWKAKKVKENEMEIKLESDDKAKDILVEIMLNSAVDYVAETTSTTLTIDDESIKSRIIGKSGRNIRTLQNLTGADVLIDESPNEVTISCFDPIRREVAALTLQSLIKSGKISPVTIEETVNKIKKEILKEIRKTGEQIAYETGFNDLPNEIIMLLGRFKYRFSYGQNLAKHTLEMVKIGEALARELNADVRITKLACLLHDLGKVAPQEGKQHHHISAEIAKKYYKDDKLINAIEAHHFDIDSKYVEAELVRIADAISGGRPGARRDSYDDYIKRIRALEDIANKHKGVKESYALQAGKEVRVIVKPEEIDDEKTKVMAYDIAKEIEETQNYPGVVRVTVIRETRAVQEAR